MECSTQGADSGQTDWIRNWSGTCLRHVTGTGVTSETMTGTGMTFEAVNGTGAEAGSLADI